MSKPVVAVIAQGAMGGGVGGRLAAHGTDVVTSLEGRSAKSAERAAKAGMRAVAERDIAAADIILSIVPPSEAMALAERLAPHLKAAARKPLYIDCNAISAELVQRIGERVAATGAPFADGGIIGGPPRAGYDGPSIYVAAAPAGSLAPLVAGGLAIKPLDGPVGAASALKMSYAAITKGLTAIASASILGAAKYGASDALHAELASSQKAILPAISRAVPDMFDKAYRFVGEMEEIADHFGRPSSAEIYRGMAKLYQEIADDKAAGGKNEIARLAAFFRTQKCD
jgi:3-hydroxyisobutyrate dehydrogenase-like beta-hydroxyacid dehydrogenase